MLIGRLPIQRPFVCSDCRFGRPSRENLPKCGAYRSERLRDTHALERVYTRVRARARKMPPIPSILRRIRGVEIFLQPEARRGAQNLENARCICVDRAKFRETRREFGARLDFPAFRAENARRIEQSGDIAATAAAIPRLLSRMMNRTFFRGKRARARKSADAE